MTSFDFSSLADKEVRVMTNHHLFRAGGRLVPVVLLCAGVLSIPDAASASLTSGTLVRIPDNPLGGSATCAALVAQQEAKGSVNSPDSEVEPYVTVDPTNPKHLVAAIQQDRWNDGGDNGNTAAVSTDGGAHWSLAAGQPAFTICLGATSGSTSFFNRASDPWVTFSSDGKTVYQSSLAFNANGPAFGGASSIQVSTSTDGGNHLSRDLGNEHVAAG
jgi:hypothetical protein